MLKIFQDFEQIAVNLRPIVLIAPGLAAIVVGLFVWLGGLGLRRPLVGLVGAIIGGIGGFLLIGRNTLYAAASAVITALVAAILQRVVIALVAAGLAAVVAFAIVARPYVETADAAVPASVGRTSEQTVSVRESMETVKAYAVRLNKKIRKTCSLMPAYRWAIIALLALISIVAGFWLWRLASALCCAVVGATLIFAGMIFLLSYKGSAPISKICYKPSFYGAVFLAMTAFGTAGQLLLCRRAERKATKKKRADKGNEPPGQTRISWRTS